MLLLLLIMPEEALQASDGWRAGVLITSAVQSLRTPREMDR